MVCTEVDFAQSCVTVIALWYKRKDLFAGFLYFLFYSESFISCEKGPLSFMGRGVFLLVSDGQCLPSGTGVLEPVFAVMRATQMLKSYSRRMTEQGWKCFLSNSKIENHILFFFFPWEKIETIHYLMIHLWAWNSSTCVLYVPTLLFSCTFYYSVHRKRRNLSSMGVTVKSTQFCNYKHFPLSYWNTAGVWNCLTGHEFTV